MIFSLLDLNRVIVNVWFWMTFQWYTEVDSPLSLTKAASNQRKPLNKKLNCVKAGARRDSLVLGVDVLMDDAKNFSKTTMVGRADGRHFGRDFLNRWDKEQWGKFLPWLHSTRVLVICWISFIFDS